MKIAIVGAGFYGCHLAKKISTFANVDIYDTKDDIMTEAIKNNQHRLHLGYHYPKCDFTIQQAIRSYNLFIKEYNSCVEEVENNYYIIHKTSNINFDEYIKTYNKYNLNFKIINLNEINSYLNHIENYQGAIKTEEKKINLNKLISSLKQEIKNNKNINIFTKTKIEDIYEDSSIKLQNKILKYDYVINTTYTSPQLGIFNENFDIKNELCFMLLLESKNNNYNNKSFTIMDGDHVSLYKADEENTFTLSSVKLTPYFKDTYTNLQNISLDKSLINKINDEILQHGKDYLILDDFRILRTYVSYKTKIKNDTNFYRGSFYKRYNNNISIMSGKISAALDIEKNILEEITR